MEGHHIIPCNVKNSKEIKEEYKSRLDREENIVCICPNCHRKVHSGNEEVKREILKKIYNKKKEDLEQAGIYITFDKLFAYYKR
ncbi:MAG: hypothetical protein LBM93_13690 [Oscillospiraceae bacterium]|jgi:5-methylcytosine-specific restriction protein A|nr:hypothetical protein [Oscillospiraceae bacterium]